MENQSKQNSISTSFSDFEFQEHFLFKKGQVFKTVIEKIKNEIVVKIRKYKILFNINNISLYFDKEVDTIDKAYKFINKLFEEKKVAINEDFMINKEIQLDFLINKGKKIPIHLKYYEKNSNYIINELNNLKNDNIKLKKEINILKSYHEKPKSIKLMPFKIQDCYACTNLDNVFTVFKSIENIFYIIYSNINKSLITYDLIKQKNIAEIKKCHNDYISNIKHYLDKINKKDYIMSVSFRDNNLKMWDFKNWECKLNIPSVNSYGFLDSACFLNENNQNFIITSNCCWGGGSEPIKIFDFDGNKINEINDSNEKTYFVDSFFDEESKKNYIISGNENYVKSYDYTKNELYHKYYDNENRGHFSFILNKTENITKLIESCFDGNIRIWNFHNAVLLKKIKINNGALFGICLLNGNDLLVGSEDKTIKLIDLKNGIVAQNLNGHNKWAIAIKKINHPQFGVFIISQGHENDQIKIWKYNS